MDRYPQDSGLGSDVQVLEYIANLMLELGNTWPRESI